MDGDEPTLRVLMVDVDHETSHILKRSARKRQVFCIVETQPLEVGVETLRRNIAHLLLIPRYSSVERTSMINELRAVAEERCSFSVFF
jgi:hypothetical protein